jgi:hypothetical protein
VVPVSTRPVTGEGRLERVGWRVLGASGQVVEVRVARWVAAVVLRARARSAAGWLEGVHRVATRPAPGSPALTMLPDELRPGDVVLDVGAHIGVHALTAAARLRQLARRRGPDVRRRGLDRRQGPDRPATVPLGRGW